MYYVYVLKSALIDKYYVGLTNNLERRLKQHEQGQSPSTKWRLPVQLIYVDICETREAARIREKYFKSGFGREIIKEINADVAELVYAQS